VAGAVHPPLLSRAKETQETESAQVEPASLTLQLDVENEGEGLWRRQEIKST
jgi:hypothetical protein